MKKLAILSIYIIRDIFWIFFSKYASIFLIRNVFNSRDFCFLLVKNKHNTIRFSSRLIADYAMS